MLIERLPKILGINYISVYMYVHVYQVELIPDFIYLRNTQKLATILDSSNCLTHLLYFLHIFLYFIWLFLLLISFCFSCFSNVKKNLDNNFHARNACAERRGDACLPHQFAFQDDDNNSDNNRKIAKNFDLS